MVEKKSIDVEQINIVDENGTVRLSLFNNQNIPPAIIDGEDILPGHRQCDPIAGLMFYNAEGDEAGGLIFGSERDENGNYTASASLTFDQYKQDQVVQMHYSGENGNNTYGFSIWDRPNTSLKDQVKKDLEIKHSTMPENEKQAELDKLWKGHAHRAFMGKTANGDVTVQLSDSKGQPRIRMVVDSNDVPRMEFLDGDGNVIYKLPPE
ncbi:hypothetical protein [Bacillus sp. FJAT-27245]|uniref:hypothetical protein n=1 Tax=Bacillus sp. FJAT-27245 TaxID=1684144 RepID=UPI0006A79DFE|nr:hypothetical protein [Bacillus sp. FJAT-27245]